MNLTRTIISRKLDSEPDLKFLPTQIQIGVINISIEIPSNLTVADKEEFEMFKSNYSFPKNEELRKKDRLEFEKALFPPLFILKNEDKNYPKIACYLFNVYSLKGETSLNIRSITKYELMWVEYLVESRNSRRVNVKKFNSNGFDGALSEDYKFNYRNKGGDEKLTRLRILNLEIRNYVLAFYIFDNEADTLTQESLTELIEGIKTNGNNI